MQTMDVGTWLMVGVVVFLVIYYVVLCSEKPKAKKHHQTYPAKMDEVTQAAITTAIITSIDTTMINH